MKVFLFCCIVFGCFCIVLRLLLSNRSHEITVEKRLREVGFPRPHRQKRYLNMPEGASVQLVYCFLMTAIGTEQYFTLGLSLGLAWEVPSNLPKLITEGSSVHRRDKRSLYPKVEVFIDKLGYNGKQCILKFLCETKSKVNTDLIFIERLFQVIFTYQQRSKYEPEDAYDTAHHREDCACYEELCPIKLYLS